MPLAAAAPETNEVAAHDPAPTRGANCPSSVAREGDRMLWHEHTPRSAPRTQRRAMLSDCRGSAGHAEPNRLAKAPRVAQRFQPQRLRGRDAMGRVERKGIGPEASVMVSDATPTLSNRRWTDPVRELVEEREAGIGFVAAGDDGDARRSVPRHARRSRAIAAAPTQDRHRPAGGPADRRCELDCPGRNHALTIAAEPCAASGSLQPGTLHVGTLHAGTLHAGQVCPCN